MGQISLRCKQCNKIFQRQKFQHNLSIKRGAINFFCTNKCRALFYRENLMKNLTPFQRKYDHRIRSTIKELKSKSKIHQEIADELKVPLGSISYLLRS